MSAFHPMPKFGVQPIADRKPGCVGKLMPTAEYERKLHGLRSAILMAQGAPFSIEKELSALLAEGGPTLSADLLLSLSDEAHSGAMYALVHAAESLEEQPYSRYVSDVLSSLPRLYETAPNWSLNVLRRIMSADAPLDELVRQVRDAPAPVKEIVRSICRLNDAIVPDYIHEAVKEQVAAAAA